MARFGRTFVFPVWTHGFLGNTPPVGTTPIPILVVENVDRRHRYPPLDPIAIHGLVLPAAPTANPPPVLVVENAERRRRYPPLDPVVLTGRLAPDAGPVILSVDRPERRRPPLDPVTLHGPADADARPVILSVDRPERRRQQLDAVIIKGAVVPAAAVTAGDFFRLF